MKYSMLLPAAALFLGLSMNVQAGFVGETDQTVNTVAQVQSMKDESKVVLQGYIEKHLGGEDYMFKDDTGSIKVEIDDDDWGGLDVTAQDKIEIRGEVDTHHLKPTDIDVDSVRLIK